PDDEFVSLDCGDDRFMQLKPESVGAVRWWFAAGDVSVGGLTGDLDGDPGDLRVAVFTRVGVDGTATVSFEVQDLDRVRHRAERQVRALELDLRATDPRGAVLTEGGQDVRLGRFEPCSYHPGELAGLAFKLCPCCHAQQSASRRGDCGGGTLSPLARRGVAAAGPWEGPGHGPNSCSPSLPP